MRILELGSYLAPAYAGMILAEQGHHVTKWSTGDPIHSLRRGQELWKWVNHGKTLKSRHARSVLELPPGQFDIVLDNYRVSTWQRWGVDPAPEAARLGVTWVSLRADDDQRSFDVIAQARAWGDKGRLPFYIGDTAAGLWLAFKALAAPPGHHIIRQAACLAKLVEGELVTPVSIGAGWDAPGTYEWVDGVAHVAFRGESICEPARDDEWRALNLNHRDGRYLV